MTNQTEAEALGRVNATHLADLLEREGHHSGVWFGDHLLEAAALIRRLVREDVRPCVSQDNSNDACVSSNGVSLTTSQQEPAQELKTTIALHLTDAEIEAIEKLSKEQELSAPRLLIQGLRLYQLHHERLKAGETCTWSGDAQRARDFAGPLAAQEPDAEIAWLIERGDIATVESCNHVCLHYYAEWPTGKHYWTPDHLKAKRFACEADAKAASNNDPLLRVTEHMWLATAKAALPNLPDIIRTPEARTELKRQGWVEASVVIQLLKNIDRAVSHGKMGDWSIALNEIRRETRWAIAELGGSQP